MQLSHDELFINHLIVVNRKLKVMKSFSIQP